MIQKDGFSFKFDASKCEECGGKCCIGDSGYVFLKIDEMNKIARYLNLNIEDFQNKYIRKVGNKYSLIEKPHPTGKACIFFDDVNKCKIYEVRPNNCKTFPFWDIFKNNSQGVKRECIGVFEE